MKRIWTLSLCALLALNTLFIPSLPATAEGEISTAFSDSNSYSDYLAGIKEKNYTGKRITVPGTAGTGNGSATVTLPDGQQALLTTEDGDACWSISIPEAGMYAFALDYYPYGGNGSQIGRRVLIDGVIPANELESVSFGRVFRDSKKIQRVDGGNDIRSEAEELRRVLSATITDGDGFYGNALYFYLTEGEHTLTLESLSEPMAVLSVTAFSTVTELPTYEEYLKKHTGTAVKGALDGGLLIYEAEEMTEKSDSAIYGASDLTSPENSPYDYAYQKLNVIDGSRWQNVGQWVSYTVNVPQSGYYNIGLRCRQQNARQAVRKLTIDGEVPFAEAATLVIEKNTKWQTTLLGGDEPYLFWLSQGEHELRFEVALGEICDSLIEADAVLSELNSINWELMTVLGTEPDTNRDYQLDTYMPDAIERLSLCADRLDNIVKSWLSLTTEKDSSVAQLEQFAALLKGMVKKPSKIPAQYSFFRDSVSSFATLIESEKLQPLTADYIFIAEQGATLPRADSNIFVKAKYGFLRFLSSFTNNYNNLSTATDAEKSITVWIGNGLSGGRDQALVLNRLISQDYTPNSGTAVNLQLVPMGTILTATLAGKGPDVALQISGSEPVNYAMRNAVIPLSDFDDWDEIAKRFPAVSTLGFTYLDKVYAVPETMDYPVIFYRRDIMDSLGINVDKIETWDDLILTLPTVQANNMNFAIPAFYTSYYMFLFQNGGQLYNDAGTKTALGEKVALDAFNTYMKFYGSYGIPYAYSLETRIRNGEIPFAVANFSVYNILKISAPEIDGIWTMAKIPGTERSDGTIDRSTPMTCAGCVIMSSAKNVDACWNFVKWWTSADIQHRFGRELESSLGRGARYNTANIEAISMLPWSSRERAILLSALDDAVGIREVPGGYMTERNVTFALKEVYNSGADARDTLRNYISAIDDEIEIKRREFHLDD